MVLGVLLALCAAWAAYIYWPREKKPSSVGPVAAVYWNGKLADAVDLSKVEESFTRIYETPDGKKNVVEFAHGQARMLEASCPDQTCVKMGWQDGSFGIPIACIPHSVVIQFLFLEDQPSDVDTSTY